MSELEQAIRNVRGRIRQYQGRKRINEENTKATLIDPLLRALGWNLEDLDEVQREYKTKRRDRPVDYGLLILRNPKLFIEAKALNQDLSDRRWSNQIMGYAAVAGVEWVVLTNGDEYRIYNAHAAVTVDEKLFRTFRISDDTGVAVETLQLLGRERMQENRLQVLWNVHFVDRQVKAALDELFDPGDEGALVRLLRRKITGVSPANLKSSLRRARVEVTFPLVPEGDLPALDRAVAGSRKGGTKPKLRLAKGTRRRKACIGVSLSDLIEAGILCPPLELARTYRKIEVRARIEKDGTVTFDRKRTESLSGAADLAREKVLRAQGQEVTVNTNGWTFWHFVDSAGRRQAVNTLRQKYLSNVQNASGAPKTG